jgi:phosphoglycerol transferase MdoB-like AlkP superfamily enzyme
MMSYFLDQLEHKKQPFFSGLFTLSSHAPYDIPKEEANNFGFEGLEAPYVRSVMYTDQALGDFMGQMKQRPWYQNSLVVIVSDHSHNTFFNRPTYDPLYRKIPFLITGGALSPAYRGKTIGTIGSQIDIPATLLNQLGKSTEASSFVWSKDLFDSRLNPFAYYEFGGGFGWVTDKGVLVYDYDEKQVKLSTMAPEEVPQTQSEGMAYLQTLFQTFIDL